VAIELSGGNPLRLFDGGAGVGELLLFGCVLSWAAYTLIGKRLTGVTPLAITTYAALIGTAILAAAVAVRGELGLPHVSAKAWLALIYMGTIGTAIAFVWFLEGVQALGPARAAIFVNLVPVAAITLGVLLLGERITVSMLAGGALVVAGVFMINRPAATTPAPACAHPH
jgi:drug/metabolite transporter (DMT)-like permease